MMLAFLLLDYLLIIYLPGWAIRTIQWGVKNMTDGVQNDQQRQISGGIKIIDEQRVPQTQQRKKNMVLEGT